MTLNSGVQEQICYIDKLASWRFCCIDYLIAHVLSLAPVSYFPILSLLPLSTFQKVPLCAVPFCASMHSHDLVSTYTFLSCFSDDSHRPSRLLLSRWLQWEWPSGGGRSSWVSSSGGGGTPAPHMPCVPHP